MLKWEKKVCLEFSIPYYMNTAKCHDFSQHTVGTFKVVLVALFPWSKPVSSKDGQTFGIYM